MKINYFSAILAAIAAIIIFCVIAVVFNVMPVDALPTNFIGATLGALIGALITLVLLRGQTDIEEKKGKDIKILEKKTEVFQDFIKDVWKVWEDQKITIEEFKDLTSKYYQNLMIYIKADSKSDEKEANRLDKIGNCLSKMGECIDKPGETKILRDQIVEIINELSSELELGGKVNTKIMDVHDEIVFPLIFKNSILDSLNKELPVGTILEKGKYTNFKEGPYNLEHICFDFINYPNWKIIIGDFTGKNKLDFLLVDDKKYNQIDKSLRSNGIYCQRIILNNAENKDVNLLHRIDDPNNFEENDKENAPPLNFSDKESMVKYSKKRGFANTLAKRAAYWFAKARIKDLNIDIIEFFEKYVKTGAIYETLQ